jgi:hypothetical protein
MFSEEGNKAVYETLTSYGDSLNAELLGSVMASVARQGFPEVYDTVVRENLWNFLEAKGLDD